MTIEHLKDVLALDLQLVDTKIESLDGEIVTTRMSCRRARSPVLVRVGLIFAIGALLFHDDRPRGFSDREFVENDEWTLGDMLRVSDEHRRIHFHADYVRGRCVKTTVEIDREGKIMVETANRGEAATRWIARLTGKKTIGVVEGGDALDRSARRSAANRCLARPCLRFEQLGEGHAIGCRERG
jgi:hypothetical protein